MVATGIGFGSHLHYVTSLNLSFPVCKMAAMITVYLVGSLEEATEFTGPGP